MTLVAYVTASAPDCIDTSATALKQHLQTCLPAFMIPSHIVWLAELPLSTNGKLDRRALPAPADISVMPQEDIEPPRTETEIRLVQLWQELLTVNTLTVNTLTVNTLTVNTLTVNTLGRQSHFFEAGGHSLLAVTLMMRIKQEFGVGLLLSSIVSHLDLASQAELIDATLNEADTADLAEISLPEPAAAGLIRALPPQKSIYKALKLNPQDLSNNSFIALSFEAEPDLKLLRNLLQSVLSRHLGLSAQFMLVDNELYLQPAKRFMFRLEKRQSLGSLEDDLRDFIRPFSLEDGMNVRGRWLVAEPNPMLLLDFSHACIDGSGLMRILDELATADNADPDVSLAAYSALFYGSEFATLRQQHAEFWYTKLQGWQLASCPDDSKEMVTGSCLVTVGAEQKAQIEAFTSHFRISVPEFFMTVFLRLKSYLEHSAASFIPSASEQLISTIFHGRDRLEQQAVIAPLMAVLPVRVTLYGEADDEKNAQKDFTTVSQEVREACRHYLFDAEELQSRYPVLHGQALMPTTFFGYFQKAGFDGCICGISCYQLETSHVSDGQSHWDLTCEIAEHPAGFDVHLEAFSFRAAHKVENWGFLFSSILQNALNK
ncbi:condensation domain-containing protein [Xenorhabdus sp. SF857]|uniref:condensation domain-containing protein n=1 Tax=Xenorhabdus bakwenae TaxID=3026967 RepID=UPI002557EBFD|nr:condensation domain-containing protein [Xenorhabdus sp. SF857]WFQ80640.1 condensation domain-containing protein [Xenorhabdus sp. SF857]